MDASEDWIVKDPKKMIEAHQLPCGPMAVAIDGTCRRRLRDHFDTLLDRLTQETHPEGRDPEDDDLEDEHDMQEEAKKKREEAERQIGNDERMLDNDLKEMTAYESPEEEKERLIEEGKRKLDVKKELKKYEEKIMPQPKLQGNSKMLQDPSGKIKKR